MWIIVLYYILIRTTKSSGTIQSMLLENLLKVVEEPVGYLNTLPNNGYEDQDYFELDITSPNLDQNNIDENIDDVILVNETRNADLEITKQLQDVAKTIEIIIEGTT
ncbi:hypothetical protein NPIL_663311 [Nephila pilipes]|uniref:Uncharacterized protein n=1 Tax=Nephila pilipes TaxID=299642 RepID=A0A8X6MY58_NEPPI|nr:hypothetical protein NPIL_663311 [Nephila pilipes]